MTDAFTTAGAYEHGCGRGALRGRSVRRELHGLYVPGWADDGLSSRLEAAKRVLPEDEGDQHRLDRRQWNRDVWRQECLARDDHTLARVTAERMRAPRTVVLGIHEALVERGYAGPAPVFSAEWRTLFATAR